MNPTVWKDFKVLGRRKGLLVLAFFASSIVSVSSSYGAAHGSEPLARFESYVSYYSVFLPIIVGYMISSIVFAMDIGERSIEAIFTTPLSPRRILIGKAFVVAFTSWLLGSVAFAAGILTFWSLTHNITGVMKLSVAANVLIAFPLVFGLYGLAGVGYWLVPNPTAMTVFTMLLFMAAVLLLSVGPFLIPLAAAKMTFTALAISIISITLFLLSLGLINKERVTLARL